MGAGGTQAILKSPHVLLPIFPLVNVGETQFPILVRLINASQKPPSLFFLRKMEEHFNDTGSVPIEVTFQVGNGTIPFVPDVFIVAQVF